ncbi:MAG: LysR family transcriptional regulator [Solirubrobacteraceae bacterium]|nr:LysR family transcriptional regulator [Solirubrobacteraceae bacterium]
MLPSVRHLSYWLAVIEEQSFTAAAQRLRISQPALSRQVRELERQIGGELVERLPRGARPTAAGRALLPEARAAVAAAERAARVARETLELEAGDLELATLPTLAAGSLLPCIRQWHDEHPTISIHLREYSVRSMLQESVFAGVGDLAIGTRPRLWLGPIESLGWEEYVVVLPPNDVLLSADRVALEDLRERKWVLYDRRQGLSEVVLAACARAGFQPSGVVETMQVEAAARFAAAGLGPALVPVNNVPSDLAPAVRRLAVPLGTEVVAYTRSSWSPAAEAFMTIARRYVSAIEPEDTIPL